MALFIYSNLNSQIARTFNSKETKEIPDYTFQIKLDSI